MSTTPRTDAIFGAQAHAERRVGHGAEELCHEMEGELRQLGQALREANAMIRHFDNTLYPGWTNLSREDIRRGMELVEKNTAREALPAS